MSNKQINEATTDPHGECHYCIARKVLPAGHPVHLYDCGNKQNADRLSLLGEPSDSFMRSSLDMSAEEDPLDKGISPTKRTTSVYGQDSPIDTCLNDLDRAQKLIRDKLILHTNMQTLAKDADPNWQVLVGHEKRGLFKLRQAYRERKQKQDNAVMPSEIVDGKKVTQMIDAFLNPDNFGY